MKKIIATYLSISAFFTLLLLTFPLITRALTADELKSQIDGHSSQIDALEKEIASYQSQLITIGNQKDSLSTTLQQLTVSNKKLKDQIKLAEQKITQKNNDISNLGGQIDTKTQTITDHKGALEESLRLQASAEAEPFMFSLLRSEKISDGWRAVDALSSFDTKIKSQIGELDTAKHTLEDTKTATEKAKDELLALKNGLADQKKISDSTVAQQDKLLKDTKNQESNYKTLLAQKIALRDAFQKELTSYESQLNYVLNPSSLPTAGSHPLSWPLASIVVTSPFGPRSDGFHNGTDFRASIGTPVMAMADGVVDGTGNTDAVCPGASFGKFVFIKYDNGLASTFGHLSLIKASKGDRVSRGDIVGYSGSTGYSTGPHLHVSLYEKDAVSVAGRPSLVCKGKILVQPLAPTGAYLNPMLYLPALK